MKKSIYKKMDFIYLPVDGFYPSTTKVLSKDLNMEPQLFSLLNLCGIFAPIIIMVIFAIICAHIYGISTTAISCTAYNCWFFSTNNWDKYMVNF